MVKRITSDEYEKLLGSDEEVKVLNITSRLTDDMIYYESKIIHTDGEETEILSKLDLHSGQHIVLYCDETSRIKVKQFEQSLQAMGFETLIEYHGGDMRYEEVVWF